MFRLFIITINYNDAEGLKRTLDSVGMQTHGDICHIIVDGSSTDDSVGIIQDYVRDVENRELRGRSVIWVSEKDNGIYNAMNKGIEIALGRRVVKDDHSSMDVCSHDSESPVEMKLNGEDGHVCYLQFLNAGDRLANADVTELMMGDVRRYDYPDVLYGNMLKVRSDGSIVGLDRCGGTNHVTLKMFYRGCLNHSPAYIRSTLFERYGMYDETLKICSDWKFYMQSIVLGGALVQYTDRLVTVFDMGGISETRKDILNAERTMLLKQMIPEGILHDYDTYHFPMIQYDRLRKYHIWGIVYLMERVLFKLEKWRILR